MPPCRTLLAFTPPLHCLRPCRGTTRFFKKSHNLAALFVASFAVHPLPGHGAYMGPSDSAGFGIPPSHVINRLREARVFCFDVDSTVITTEGIDELAAMGGVKEQVEKLTSEAMGGKLPFHESLRQRLDIMRPHRDQINQFLAAKPFVLSDRISELVGLLHSRGAAVYLLSGGFGQMIAPVASALDIGADNIYANELRFHDDGSFKDFDPQAWTFTAGGKKRVIEHLRALHSSGADGVVIVMIGDGATDLEARDVSDGKGGADLMVGYGGNVVRDKVERGADWFVRSFADIIHVVQPQPPDPARHGNNEDL